MTAEVWMVLFVGATLLYYIYRDHKKDRAIKDEALLEDMAKQIKSDAERFQEIQTEKLKYNYEDDISGGQITPAGSKNPRSFSVFRDYGVTDRMLIDVFNVKSPMDATAFYKYHQHAWNPVINEIFIRVYMSGEFHTFNVLSALSVKSISWNMLISYLKIKRLIKRKIKRRGF